MRTFVVRLGEMWMCFSRKGRKPASVTRTVYAPGASFSPLKIPSVFVRNWWTAASPGVSERMATVAPNWGTPLASRTCPDSLPRLKTGCLLDCARREGALQVTPTVEPSSTPKHRRVPRFTRLPPRCDVRRSLLFHRVLHRELRGTGNGYV